MTLSQPGRAGLIIKGVNHSTMAKAKQKQRKGQQQKQQQQRLKWIGIGLIAAIAVLAVAGWNVQQYLARRDIGQAVASMGRQHIEVGDDHLPYHTDPPTSGPHAGAAPNGFYDSPVPDENVVHNLEHGYVAISYDCEKLADCDTVKNNIRQLLKRYNNHQLMAVPRQNRDAPLALTAWQRIDLLDEYDEDRLVAFIEAWRGRAPENVP